MACNAHICRQNLGGPIGLPRKKTVWTDNSLTKTTQLKLQHINEMRVALNAELSIRKLGTETWKNPTQYFSSAQYMQIKKTIDLCRTNDRKTAFTYIDSYEPGQLITARGTIYLRQYINILQDQCICQCHFDCNCNCDYCTCDCNYCPCNCNYVPCSCQAYTPPVCQCQTQCPCQCNFFYCPCDCNHCPCDCNHCPCQCNHGCTCNCAY